MCPKCKQVMQDGEIVDMDWSGNAIQHITCPAVQNADGVIAEVNALVDSVMA